MTIPDPNGDESAYYYRRDAVRIEADSQGHLELVLDYVGRETLRGELRTFDQIEHVVRAVRQWYQRRNSAKRRQEKIRTFKTGAIVAAVDQLAREESFEFAYRTDTQKLKLWVTLRHDAVLQIEVRYSKFQETLPKLRDIIISMRKLYDAGLRFRIGTPRLVPYDATRAGIDDGS